MTVEIPYDPQLTSWLYSHNIDPQLQNAQLEDLQTVLDDLLSLEVRVQVYVLDWLTDCGVSPEQASQLRIPDSVEYKINEGTPIFDFKDSMFEVYQRAAPSNNLSVTTAINWLVGCIWNSRGH